MSDVKSMIIMDEMVDNKDHKFGETDEYFPVYIKQPDGTFKAALFTVNDIEVGVDRATKNQEDISPSKDGDGMFSWLF